jgi:hypothetical protein
MSRSGYSDDCDGWALIRWRGAVNSAIKGRRGQQALREIVAAQKCCDQAAPLTFSTLRSVPSPSIPPSTYSSTSVSTSGGAGHPLIAAT